MGFAAVDPEVSVVPVSLQVSMVAEGSTGTVDWCFEPVRQTSFFSLPSPWRTPLLPVSMWGGWP